MNKYIDADKLIAEIERRMKCYDRDGCEPNDGKWVELVTMKHFITSLQQEQPKKSIEINGIKYKEVPAKTDDKICKDCDYFLDNGSCNLDVCPCACDDNILERIQQEQPEVDLEDDFLFNEVLNVFDFFKRLPPRDKETLDFLINLAHHFCELGETRVTGRASVIEGEYEHQPFKVAQ